MGVALYNGQSNHIQKSSKEKKHENNETFTDIVTTDYKTPSNG